MWFDPTCRDLFEGDPRTRADDETRTRDPHLGKVMRYQLRYVRIPLWESQTLADTPTLVTPGLGEKSPLTAG